MPTAEKIRKIRRSRNILGLHDTSWAEIGFEWIDVKTQKTARKIAEKSHSFFWGNYLNSRYKWQNRRNEIYSFA